VWTGLYTCNDSRWRPKYNVRHKTTQRLRRQFIEPLIGSVYQRIIHVILKTKENTVFAYKFSCKIPFSLYWSLLSTRNIWRLWLLWCRMRIATTGKLREGIKYQNAKLMHVNPRSLFVIDSQVAELISSTPKHRASHPFHTLVANLCRKPCLKAGTNIVPV